MVHWLTAAAGPYVFGIGFISFLFSKEIWLFEHNFTHFVSFWIAVYILVKKFGVRWRKYLDDYDAVSGIAVTCDECRCN